MTSSSCKPNILRFSGPYVVAGIGYTSAVILSEILRSLLQPDTVFMALWDWESSQNFEKMVRHPMTDNPDCKTLVKSCRSEKLHPKTEPDGCGFSSEREILYLCIGDGIAPNCSPAPVFQISTQQPRFSPSKVLRWDLLCIIE